MNSIPSQCRATIEAWATEAGIDRIGFSPAGEVDEAYTARYNDWLARGCNAGMDYLARYHEVRRDPRLLLDGAKTIISCAISYWHQETQKSGSPRIAMYAHGDDYHDVVRKILSVVADRMSAEWGCTNRVCVDTAPIHERYWAIRSGIGFRGRNGLLIIPGVGSYCFLGEIITTLDLVHQDKSSIGNSVSCPENCGLCVKACPGHALVGDGTMDCNKCLSYLTIEHRGDLPGGFSTGGRLAGCDTCQQVCPHNARPLPTRHPEFMLRPSLRDITRDELSALTPESYAGLFRRSALKRLKLDGILRNLSHL